MANEMRGETTVTIGGESIDVVLNMNAFRLMCQDRDMELSELDAFVNANPLEFVPCVVFWGVMNAADLKGEPRPDIAFNRLAAVVCGDMDQFTHLSEAIGSSLGTKVGGEKSGN
jgi:hypothetical protein